MTVSYTREQRKEAKKQNKGLFTISWTDPKNGTVTLYGVASKKTLERVKEMLKEITGMK